MILLKKFQGSNCEKAPALEIGCKSARKSESMDIQLSLEKKSKVVAPLDKFLRKNEMTHENHFFGTFSVNFENR